MINLVENQNNGFDLIENDTPTGQTIFVENLFDEEQQIIAAIEKNTTIEILCIVEKGTKQEAIMKEQVEAFYDAVQQECENTAPISVPEQFYRGTLRSGQVISSESSVTIIGDVNPGAKIIAQGNIIILGALKGNVHAGCTGDRSCFVFALQRVRIRQNRIIVRSVRKNRRKMKHRLPLQKMEIFILNQLQKIF